MSGSCCQSCHLRQRQGCHLSQSQLLPPEAETGVGRGILWDSSSLTSQSCQCLLPDTLPTHGPGHMPYKLAPVAHSRATSGGHGHMASTSLQGSSDNTCDIPGLLEMTGFLKLYILNWGSCASPAFSSPLQQIFHSSVSHCPPTLLSPSSSLLLPRPLSTADSKLAGLPRRL